MTNIVLNDNIDILKLNPKLIEQIKYTCQNVLSCLKIYIYSFIDFCSRHSSSKGLTTPGLIQKKKKI